MKIPLNRAYFVFWTRDPNEETDECLWGDINALFDNLGRFALNTDVFGVFTTRTEAKKEYARQLKKGQPLRAGGGW